VERERVVVLRDIRLAAQILSRIIAILIRRCCRVAMAC